MASYPVTPNGKIIVCKGIPMDREYNHTVDFADASEQETIIKTYKLREFDACTYAEKDKVYLECSKDDIAGANYLMYQNNGFSNKWWYAFITNIEYVNVDTTEVTIELDYLQTFQFNYTLEPCYIEREHSATDAIGDNLVDEGLEIGEYVQDELTPFTNFSSPCVIITSTTYIAWSSADEEWYIPTNGVFPAWRFQKTQGEYNGLYLYAFMRDLTGTEHNLEWQVGQFLNWCEALGVENSIRSIHIVPQQFVSVKQWIRRQSDNAVVYVELDEELMAQLPIEISKDTGSFSWNGKSYTPKNNKLHTYPYKALYLTTLDGNSKTYRYEFFTSSPNAYFWWRGNSGNIPGVICAPMNYKQSGVNYDEKICLSDFPQVSCASDSWQAYLAQNANTNALTNFTSALSIVGGVVGVAVGAYTGNAMAVTAGIGGITSGVTNIAKLNARINDVKAQPDNAQGTQSISTLSVAGLKNIYYTHKRITPEFAEIIDNYFSMFGYACHKVKAPNTTSRANWNYIKTVGAIVKPYGDGLDATAISAIARAYDKGLTVWHYIGIVGRYTLNNAPVS